MNIAEYLTILNFSFQVHGTASRDGFLQVQVQLKRFQLDGTNIQGVVVKLIIQKIKQMIYYRYIQS